MPIRNGVITRYQYIWLTYFNIQHCMINTIHIKITCPNYYLYILSIHHLSHDATTQMTKRSLEKEEVTK